MTTVATPCSHATNSPCRCARDQGNFTMHGMSWDRISGNWTQWKGRVRERWGRLTQDQVDVIAGRRDQLAGRIQEAYALSTEETERQLRNWERNLAVEYDEADPVVEDEDIEDEEPGSTPINGER